MMKSVVIGAIVFAVLGFTHVPMLAQSAASGMGYVKTNVKPGRAGVFIDGKYVGPAANFRMSRKYALSEGEHEIKLCDPRYEEVTRTVTIRAGQTTKLSERLRRLPRPTPPFGLLRTVGFDKYAAVYLNGRFYGHADEFSHFAQGLRLNPGKYAISVAPVGGGTAHEEDVEIEADTVTVVRAE
jgi:hypothetical protein